jgi:hypothetical protein
MEHPKEKKRNAMVLVQSEIVMWKRKKKKERVQGVKVAGSRRDSTFYTYPTPSAAQSYSSAAAVVVVCQNCCCCL